MKQTLRSVLFFCLPLLPIQLPLISAAQVVTFFQDSDQGTYYDSGLAFFTSPSALEQNGPGGSGDKIPTDQRAYVGQNSLRIRWTSRAGGDWSALVIAPGFPFQDISKSDTLAFWAFAPNGLAQAAMPTIFLEGAPGATKSRRYALADFTDELPVAQWVQVRIPLTVLFNDPNQTGINFTQIKAVIFGQNAADGTEHILLIDEVRTYPAGNGEELPTPQGLTATGFDSHVELRWTPLTEAAVVQYQLYRSVDGGATFTPVRRIQRTDSLYMDWVRPIGTNLQLQYRLTALAGNDQESAPSDIASANTRDFSDEELLTMVQAYTFRFFWDFAHPVSGLIRERNTSGDLVTTGGSGFGVMALLVGAERGFITREQARHRTFTMVNFLLNADRFRGVFPHWMDGNTGRVIPFSQKDDGGDLVETAFLFEGLLAARQYFDGEDSEEVFIREKITQLYSEIDWNWYRKQNQNVLFWHWSPTHQFAINLPVRGWNETMMVYLLGIAAPNRPIPANLWDKGWAGGNYRNGSTQYGYLLPLGQNLGGPLFFTHYSFLGFDPRNRRDAYANYWTQNRNQTLINRAYCIANPRGHQGYGPDSWGLTASDDPFGYLAHAPGENSDNGTITPTAALSSMPYTPAESMAALRYFYRQQGERLWGPMGFYDAYNLNEDWFARSYLAIDQGPIIGMIENHRSGLLWNLFMNNPEIQAVLENIGFAPDSVPTGLNDPLLTDRLALVAFPNPAHDQLQLELRVFEALPLTIDLLSLAGQPLKTILPPQQLNEGAQTLTVSLTGISPGLYTLRLQSERAVHYQKIVIY